FDRTGGNHSADAAHFIRQIDDTHNVALDELGPGILWFVRHNHWHGSPWEYLIDGHAYTVTETSTADPVHPVADSVFEPAKLFPQGLTYTWSVTKGADLSWVPMPFVESLRLSYGRARYGTGYFILWKTLPGLSNLSQPMASWGEHSVPPPEVLELIGRSGTDIAPQGDGVTTASGRVLLAAHGTQTMWHGDAGPTTIRRIALRVPEASAAQFAEARLRVYWDDRSEPSIDAPVGLFFGAGSLLRDPDQEYIVKSFPMTIQYTDGEFLFATYFPMPYQRSARIELSEQTGSAIDGIAWEVRHVPFDEPANSAGYFHATYRDFPHPEPGRDLELLDTRDVEGGGEWAGHIVGTTYTFTHDGELRTLEGDPRFYLDDSASPQGQGTGSEEWGGGGDYWGGLRMTLPFAGHPVGRPRGQMKQPIDRIHSAYRFLLSDLIPFGRNARFTLEHGGHNNSQEHYRTVTYWYGLPKATLRLTDYLDVGSKESETAHDYESPDSSEATTLASRHEVGVDHIRVAADGPVVQVVPETAEDGRRTTTYSQFALNIDPTAIGVMLRRWLDLSSPNQRARVSVADADAGTPDWQDAGVWYTAGSNTVVYGDPHSLPPEERKMHEELHPPVHVVQTSNRRWRDDEFLLPVALTRGRSRILVRFEHEPVDLPLYPGYDLPESVWTEFAYWAYCFTMPQADSAVSENNEE
ncbi:MAG: DUF2961 domain-containing protein, partial [Planctomycetales bacterium]|nr:DUF2961 domain-containing protein [Planctomycetales bacterium]